MPKATQFPHSPRTTRKRTEPAFIEPMQCKSVTALPAGETWAFEVKLDGYRCIAVKRGTDVTLFSRHKKVLNRRFPGVVEAFASLEGDFVLDGELVALDSQGRPSFQLVQNIFLSNFLSIVTPIYYTGMASCLQAHRQLAAVGKRRLHSRRARIRNPSSLVGLNSSPERYRCQNVSLLSLKSKSQSIIAKRCAD